MTDKKDQKSSSKTNLNESTLPLLDSPPENAEKGQELELETKNQENVNSENDGKFCFILNDPYVQSVQPEIFFPRVSFSATAANVTMKI